MKTRYALIGTLSLLPFASMPALAGEVTGLVQFKAGDPAKASEVNANFNAVKTAVDDNNARITANTNALAGKADSANVYTKTEVDSGLATKADTAALSGKANSADVYTKSQIDTVNNTQNTTLDSHTTSISTLNSTVSGLTSQATSIADLQQHANQSGLSCAGNDINDIMVRVGPLCVDKYEASVWSTASGGTQFGASADNYPCDNNGKDCAGPNVAPAKAIYARSRPGVMPSANITWFQAQQACAAAGKRLLTNAEWQMAAAGTTKANCNSTGGVFKNTDANPTCTSNYSVVNMAGNMHEWVADWIPGNLTNTTANVALSPSGTTSISTPSYSSSNLGAAYDNDTTSGVQPSDTNTLPAAIYRGGGAGGGGIYTFNASQPPSFSAGSVSFRCAR